MRRSAFFLTILAFLVMSACAGQSSTSTITPTHTPVLSPTPTLPTGDYAFIRNGDIWAHTGNAPAHAITQLHLSAAGAQWGSLIWSPDHATIAFVLNAPPFAPGFVAQNPAQTTGTLFTVDVASGKLTLVDTTGAVTVPLLGQHVAWLHNNDGTNSLLFTHAGMVEQITAGAANPAPILGLHSVWEIAVHGATLFYSTLTHVTATSGLGMAELHTFDLISHKDALVTQLGPATLPNLLCGGVICPPDTTTPVVPYTWSANADGTQVAYETVLVPVNHPTPTPTPKGTPSPTPTHAVALAATATPPLAGVVHFYVAQTDGSKFMAIFTDLPPLPDAMSLAFAPDGHAVALAATTANEAPVGPFAQMVAGTGTVVTFPASTTHYAGIPSWSPDSQGFSLTAFDLSVSTPTLNVTTFFLNGQDATLEQNGAQLTWGQ